jgi:hypothetical protein
MRQVSPKEPEACQNGGPVVLSQLSRYRRGISVSFVKCSIEQLPCCDKMLEPRDRACVLSTRTADLECGPNPFCHFL